MEYVEAVKTITDAVVSGKLNDPEKMGAKDNHTITIALGKILSDLVELRYK